MHISSALSAGLFAIFKVIFTNNQTFLLDKSWRAKIYRTLLMHWFVYFFNASILSRVREWSGSGTNTRLRTRLSNADHTTTPGAMSCETLVVPTFTATKQCANIPVCFLLLFLDVIIKQNDSTTALTTTNYIK